MLFIINSKTNYYGIFYKVIKNICITLFIQWCLNLKSCEDKLGHQTVFICIFYLLIPQSILSFSLVFEVWVLKTRSDYFIC